MLRIVNMKVRPQNQSQVTPTLTIFLHMTRFSTQARN